MTYLITGATGPIGRLIVDRLISSGKKVRIVTRDAAKAPSGTEVVEGDFTKGTLPNAAFQDVERAFVFPAIGGVDGFLNQAKKSGVEGLVILSSLAAAMEHERDIQSPSALHHQAIERAVKSTGLPSTILRPGSFANNLLFWSHSIKSSGVVYGPYATSAQAPIHEADIAELAALVLTESGHENKIYPLTGPQALTRVEQLDTIGEALGRRLQYQEIPPQAFEKEMSKYMPAPIIKMLLDYWSDTTKSPDKVLNTFELITKRKARTLEQWAKDHASDFGGNLAR